MSKAILIFINIIGFLIFTILNINEVVITHTAPKEIAIGQEVEVSNLLNNNNFTIVSVESDLAKIPRCIVAKK